MARKIATGIDIGTHQIKVAVVEGAKSQDGSNIANVIGTGTASSKGLRHGRITNINDVTKSIRLAISQAEKTSKLKIKKVFLSIGGIGLETIIAKGSVMISKADSEITDLDVKKVLAVAESEIPKNALVNKEIIHSIPLSYKIDDELLMARPKGMHATKLEVKVLFIICLRQYLNDLIKAAEDAGVDVVDVIASPLASGIVNLSKTQKIAGSVLANIGSETVSLLVYENNIPISLEVFPIGGSDITNDIALGFRIPIEEAENIKLGFNTSAEYSKKKLEEIIDGRLVEIFNKVESHLKKIGRNGLLPAGIIITGGGSGTNLIEETAKNLLKLPSSIAGLNLISSLKNNHFKDPSWSVAYGLSVWGLNNGEDTSIELDAPGNRMGGILNWLKQFLP